MNPSSGERHFDPGDDMVYVAGHWIPRADPNPHLRGDDPFAAARMARQVADQLQQSGRNRDIVSVPNNFLPPEQRTTVTVPAGTSVYGVPNPRPQIDAQQDRYRAAQMARSVEQQGRLSGSHVRTTSAESWAPRAASREAATYGAAPVDWSQVNEGGE